MQLVVLAFIGVRSYKHTIYFAMRVVFPYVFLFVFRIARSRTVWVTVIFKAWFLSISYCFLYCVQNIFSFGFIKAFDSKQIRARTCKDCVISREINTLLKMAVFGKSCWNVGTRKMLRSVLKRYFFGFIEALASKGILNTWKKEITSAMECADLAAFTFATWLMRSLTL